MPQSPPPPHELDCPNCGASYELPRVGNRAVCEYCGSQFFVPTVAHAQPFTHTAISEADVKRARATTVRWIKIFLIILVAGFVLPTVCALGLSLCVAFVNVLIDLFR